MEHWTQFLEEGNRIYKDDVRNLERINLRIEKLWSEIEQEIKLLHKEEDNLFFKVQKQYSSEEINIAKKQFNGLF